MGRRVSFRKIIAGCFTPRASSSSCSCFWVGSRKHGDPERKPLVLGDNPTQTTPLRLKDIISGNQTLGFHLEPKMVTLKVSMHCDGCATRVEKHISKMDGVTSYKVDLENKRVVVVGDVIPVEVVESVSKVKSAKNSRKGIGGICRTVVSSMPIGSVVRPVVRPINYGPKTWASSKL